MAHFADRSHPETRLVLLGDRETIQHRDELSADAARQGCVVVDAFGFGQGEPGSTDELTEIDAVVEALGCAIAGRMDLWVPFPGPDLFYEQHWRRLSLVMQRHGLNLRVGRDLVACLTEGGYSEIDFALRREVQAVDNLDNAVLAAAGVKSLQREIEVGLASVVAHSPGRAGTLTCQNPPPVPRSAAPNGSVSTPMLPAPTAPWKLREPELKRYVRWLVHGCGVTQAAAARVLNSTGQRTPRGRLWQPASVSKLLNGR
ncbi:MAG TPA: hypothetical protein VF299_03520 [Mycobacterium sp.]